MIPTLFIISVVAFWLGRLAPGDPAKCGNALDEIGERDYQAYLKEYEKQFRLKGLNNPSFYFTLNSLAHTDTLQRIFPKTQREVCQELIQYYGNWPAIQKWRQGVDLLNNQFLKIKPDLEENLAIDLADDLKLLKFLNSHDAIAAVYNKFKRLELPEILYLAFQQSEIEFKALEANAQRWKLWIPTLSWNGLTNQYHSWIANIVRGDFGISCRNNLPAVQLIGPSLKWTLMMTIPAIILIFLIGIPLGIYSGLNEGSRFDQWSSYIAFLLFALPSFWVAILLLVFFTTPEYSPWLDWFPSIGLGRLPATAPFWSRFWETASHLILPIICLSYGSIAFVSRQMRGGVLNVLPQQFILTAKAKGLSSQEVTRKHILKNSLFPILTLTAGILPTAVSGSVLIEFIFNIPGMGRTTLEAIFSRDWPVVYAILFLGAGLTIIGIFITDLLYAWADPRVKFKSSSTTGE